MKSNWIVTVLILTVFTGFLFGFLTAQVFYFSEKKDINTRWQKEYDRCMDKWTNGHWTTSLNQEQ